MIQELCIRALDAYDKWAERDAERHPDGRPLLAAAILTACVIITGVMEAV